MSLNYPTNFYVRRDSENLLWCGLSVSIPEEEYSNYKVSCFVNRQNKKWKAGQSDIIIFDKNNNMYRIIDQSLSNVYNPYAKDRNKPFSVSLSRPDDNYINVEETSINLNESVLKNVIDELKDKTEQSFGIKLEI